MQVSSSSSSSSNTSYTISAQPNPFVPQFRDISLSLLDRDTEAERLIFEFPLDLGITPSAALDDANTAATCWFNNTRMGATIWTRKRAEFPVNMTSSVNATNPSSEYDNWPFAVQVQQRTGEGVGIPSCVDSSRRPLGDFAATSGAEGCGCSYSNFKLGS